jgi:hypothetical protein
MRRLAEAGLPTRTRYSAKLHPVTSLPSPEVLTAARSAFAFLSEVDPLPPSSCDAVIGFGTFDVTLASFCGELYAQQHARRIIFTGGFGAGTTDLGKPEADAWREQLARTNPVIPAEHVITENQSTNTAENIEFTAELLAQHHPAWMLGRGLNAALIVASPSRLRRVKLTLQHKYSSLRICRRLPHGTNFEHEFALYESKRLDYVAHLVGELERLTTYPQRGWIANETIPPEIVAATCVLKQR